MSFHHCPFSIPVGSSLAIKISTSGLGDSDICSGDRYRRTGPFFIAKGGDTFEDDLCSVSVFHASTFGYVLTLVPLVRPVRSNVVREGTARADRTMVEQEVFDLTCLLSRLLLIRKMYRWLLTCQGLGQQLVLVQEQRKLMRTTPLRGNSQKS